MAHAQPQLPGKLGLPDLLEIAVLKDLVDAPRTSFWRHVAGGSKRAYGIGENAAQFGGRIGRFRQAKRAHQRVFAQGLRVIELPQRLLHSADDIFVGEHVPSMACRRPLPRHQASPCMLQL